jgi:adenylate cyclase
MHPNLVRKLKSLGLICLFTCFAGVLFQLIGEQHLNYNSVLMGFPLGLGFGVLELFLFPRAVKRFRQWPFIRLLIFKTLLYSAVIYIVTVSIAIITGLPQGHELHEIPTYLTSSSSMILVFYTLVVYSLLVFFLQMNHLLGEGVLWKFISGQYYQPREE